MTWEAGVLKVAVVDDSLLIQRGLARLFESVDGVEVVGFAEDVHGAIALIESTRPDVVVLDVALRQQERGMDVLRYIVKEHPDTRVIAVSNFTWQAMRDGFLQAGASAYFDKATEFTKARDWLAAQLGQAASSRQTSEASAAG